MIARAASNQQTSSARIRSDYDLPISSRAVRYRLQEAEHLSWRKKRKGPVSNDQTKRQRLAWGQEHQHLREELKLVIFSDEKKFNLDGPDGLNYYWHDTRKEEMRYFKRQQGGGGCIFWGCIGSRGLGQLVLINGKMDSIMYQHLLRDYMLPHAVQIAGPDYVFQHDGASVHRSRSTKAWLARRNVEVLPWAPYSPDLNIIENLWGYMVRDVYSGGRVYSNKDELEVACRQAWGRIDQAYINSLYNSIPNRVTEVIEARGGFTSY